jgi:putative hydrolase of the HAD superfamily
VEGDGMNSAGVIFDGDDTLWETMPVYTKAKQEFFSEMASLGFDRQEVESTFESTDVANVSRLGFTKHRFPTSMAETYQAFCNKYRRAAEDAIEQRVKGIGYSVFGDPPIVFDHAQGVLSQLRPHYKLILATKGDREVQQAKINLSGLADFFSEIYILDHKTDKELQHIVKDSGLEVGRSWIVGNSLRSDINPGLRVGLKAIWIPYHTWDYEEDVEPNSQLVYKVNSLAGSLSILLPE